MKKNFGMLVIRDRAYVEIEGGEEVGGEATELQRGGGAAIRLHPLFMMKTKKSSGLLGGILVFMGRILRGTLLLLPPQPKKLGDSKFTQPSNSAPTFMICFLTNLDKYLLFMSSMDSSQAYSNVS